MQHALDTLRALDEQVHRSPNAHAALLDFTAKLRDYDPVLVSVIRALKAIPALSERAYREQLFARIQKCKSAVALAWANAAETTAAKLPRNSVIGTNGSELIALALTRSKKSVVHVYDNASFAKELSKQHISVIRYSPRAALALTEATDALLVPCIAIDDSHIIAQAGAATLVRLAHGRIPVYAVAIAFQYDPQASRAFPPAKLANRGQHAQDYLALQDSIPGILFEGIITELGVFTHKRFVAETKAHYPWAY